MPPSNAAVEFGRVGRGVAPVALEISGMQ